MCFTQAFCDDHLKFLGFPIDGTVDEYASKIKSKGFYVSPDNEYAPKGLRIMEGPFLGKTRNIGLHYNKETKTIYGVTLVEKFFLKKMLRPCMINWSHCLAKSTPTQHTNLLLKEVIFLLAHLREKKVLFL